jgi:hypothetical protein
MPLLCHDARESCRQPETAPGFQSDVQLALHAALVSTTTNVLQLALFAVPVRTPAELPLRLHSLHLRFYSLDTMFQPAVEAADAHLRAVVSEVAREVRQDEAIDLPSLLNSAGAFFDLM